MDIGIFKRGRRQFATWIVAPVISIIGIQFGSTLYCMQIDRTLEQTVKMRNILPETDSCLNKTKITLDSYHQKTSTGDIATELNNWLSNTGMDINIRILTLSIQPLDPLSHHGFKTVRAHLSAHGTLASVARFIDHIEEYSPLINLERIELKQSAVRRSPEYSLDISFILHQFDPALMEPPS